MFSSRVLLLLTVLVMLVMVQTSHGQTCANNYPLHAPLQTLPPCFSRANQTQILSSTAMPPSVGLTTLKLPFDAFMDFFLQTALWPLWNPFVTAVDATSPVLCQNFPTTVTNSPYETVPSTAKGFPPVIVANTRNATDAQLGWSYLTIDTANNAQLIFGRHDYYIHDVGDGTIVFSSWEKASGSLVAANSNAWIAGLQEAMLDTIVGVSCLEMVWAQYGVFTAANVNASCSYLQLARPTLTTVPVPAGFVESLLNRNNDNNDNGGGGGGNNAAAIVAGVLCAVGGAGLGAFAMWFHMRNKRAGASEGLVAQSAYVSMR